MSFIGCLASNPQCISPCSSSHSGPTVYCKFRHVLDGRPLFQGAFCLVLHHVVGIWYVVHFSMSFNWIVGLWSILHFEIHLFGVGHSAQCEFGDFSFRQWSYIQSKESGRVGLGNRQGDVRSLHTGTLHFSINLCTLNFQILAHMDGQSCGEYPARMSAPDGDHYNQMISGPFLVDLGNRCVHISRFSMNTKNQDGNIQSACGACSVDTWKRCLPPSSIGTLLARY